MDQTPPATAGDAHILPPAAQRIPRDVTVHGDRRTDEYYWMRERDRPEVRVYLEAENAYAAAQLAATETLQKTLYEEMVGRIQETDATVPVVVDDWLYYQRTEEGKQYTIHCRRRNVEGDAEEIILDENELAAGNAYFSLGAFAVSPDHRLLAYAVDLDGSESHTLYILDLDSGAFLDAPIGNASYGAEWSRDGATLYYATLDAQLRPYRLYRHRVGTRTADDALVYQENDDAFFMSISKTRSRRFLVMNLGSNTTSEEWVIDADRPDATPVLVEARRREVEYYVAHHGDDFFVLTNENAKNFKVMRAPATNLSAENWEEVLPHRPAVKIDDIDVFSGHLVVYEREDGLKRIRVIELISGKHHYVAFREPVYTFWATENPAFESSVLRFNYTSLVTPRTVIDYDMAARTQTIRKREPVLGGYDPANYNSERIFATAADGTRVPVSLVYRRGTKLDGSAPALLYGYGAYGASMEPYFVGSRVSLLDRGIVYAVAHVRGGGEMGRQWYDRGKLLHKRNSFTDFIACASYLIEKGYTSAQRMACSGGSAGGMLIGAVLNMRPDLFGAAVLAVPFVDVVNTMLDESIPLTVLEYEEWGNPAEKKFYEYIRSYSPYDNIAARNYPPTLVLAGFNDPRVPYWESVKYVARLRATRTDSNVVILKVRMNEGHMGASGRYDYLREVALQHGFVIHSLGAPFVPTSP